MATDTNSNGESQQFIFDCEGCNKTVSRKECWACRVPDYRGQDATLVLCPDCREDEEVEPIEV